MCICDLGFLSSIENYHPKIFHEHQMSTLLHKFVIKYRCLHIYVSISVAIDHHFNLEDLVVTHKKSHSPIRNNLVKTNITIMVVVLDVSRLKSK